MVFSFAELQRVNGSKDKCMRTIVILHSIVVIALVAGCRQRPLVLEKGRWTYSQDEEPNFILYVSSVFPQRLDIKIDGILAVSEEIRTPARHGHRRQEEFLFLLRRGPHRLEIESRTSGAEGEWEIEIEEKLWAVISSGAKGFSIEVSDSPIGFL